MMDRIISISAAPYDGYEFPAILESIASIGARYIEPAFIVGSPYVRLNYDAGNTVSHRPGQVDPAKDAFVNVAF